MCGYVPLGVFFDHAIFYHYQEACSHQLVYGGQGIRRVCRFCTSLLGPRLFFFFLLSRVLELLCVCATVIIVPSTAPNHVAIARAR